MTATARPAQFARYAKSGDDGMNKTERRYWEEAKLRVADGEIRRVDKFPESLRMADGTHYRPDFREINASGEVEMIDVKGRKSNGKPHIEPVAWLKIKVCAGLHPYKFVVAWPTKGNKGWDRIIILPEAQ